MRSTYWTVKKWGKHNQDTLSLKQLQTYIYMPSQIASITTKGNLSFYTESSTT